MKAGKYVFIDIGCAETKIIEANVQQRCITLLKSAEMRDMSQFVSDTHTIVCILLYAFNSSDTEKIFPTEW